MQRVCSTFLLSSIVNLKLHFRGGEWNSNFRSGAISRWIVELEVRLSTTVIAAQVDPFHELLWKFQNLSGIDHFVAPRNLFAVH